MNNTRLLNNDERLINNDGGAGQRAHKVLLTVSGAIAPDIKEQIAQGQRPLADYLAMAHTFGADLLDYTAVREQAGLFGKLLAYMGGPNLLLAWSCFRQRGRYRVIFSDGEQVGIPLALLLKFAGSRSRPRHLMIGHILSVGKKKPFFDWLGIQSHIDRFFVYSTWQKQFIEQQWQVPPERVVFTPFMVDAHFFSPGKAIRVKESPILEMLEEQRKPIICSVGLEFRDYPTLITAVAGLDVQVVIAAASPWSKRADTTEGQDIPENVIVHRFTQFELRRLYALSRFFVMPLYNVQFQAGVTAILEAMAMAKAVICSHTPGQTDVVLADKSGLYVPPGDPDALRQAILHLLNHPEEADQMGQTGRQRIEHAMSLDCYVTRLNRHVQEVQQEY